MKRLSILLLFLALPVFQGCRTFTIYVHDRARDFADIFSASVGYGMGADVRLHVTDLFYPCIGHSEMLMTGFRGRYSGTWEERHLGFLAAQTEAAYYQFFGDRPDLWRIVTTYHDWEEKNYTNPRMIPKAILYDFVFSPFGTYDGTLRDTEYPVDTWVVGFGFSCFAALDVKVNLMELVDFFTGIVTIDVVGDDRLTRLRLKEEQSRKYTRAQEMAREAITRPPLGIHRD